jgi:hypothetical protein
MRRCPAALPKEPLRCGSQSVRGKTITLTDFAGYTKLPVEFLSKFVEEIAGVGLRIGYRSMDGAMASRQRIRTALVAREGSSWQGEGNLLPYALWLLENARGMGFLMLVEGETCCLTLLFHQIPALGIPGAGSVNCLQAEHLSGIPKIFIVREPDAGGRLFVTGLQKRLVKIGWRGKANVISLPVKDSSELHKVNPDGFERVFVNAIGEAKRLNIEPEGVWPACLGNRSGVHSMVVVRVHSAQENYSPRWRPRFRKVSNLVGSRCAGYHWRKHAGWLGRYLRRGARAERRRRWCGHYSSTPYVDGCRFSARTPSENHSW